MHDETYLKSLEHVLMNGRRKGDRTGTGTISTFGYQMRFDLDKGFPLLTTKKIHWKSVIWELLWFVRGGEMNKVTLERTMNANWLRERGVTIWDEWARPDGSLGPVYGAQWRDWNDEGTDQLSQVVYQLKNNPDDRRMIVSAWNPSKIPSMELPPCHCMFQFYVDRGRLSCQMYQRSCDMFLGVPFNIASYSALIHMLCHICELEPGEFIWVGGDCHIYLNHMEQVHEQLSRVPYASPELFIRYDAPTKLDGEWHLDHFELQNYESHPGIKAPVAV